MGTKFQQYSKSVNDLQEKEDGGRERERVRNLNRMEQHVVFERSVTLLL